MLLFLIAFVISYYSVNKPVLDNTIKKDYKMSEKGVTLQSYDREIHVKPYQINEELTELAQSEDPDFVVIDVPVEIKNTSEKEIRPFVEGFTVTSFSNIGFSTYSNLSLDDMMSENIGDFQGNILPGKSMKGVLNFRLDSRIINSDKLALVPWIPYDQHVTKLYEQKIYLNVDDQGKKRVNDMDKIKELSQKGQQKKTLFQNLSKLPWHLKMPELEMTGKRCIRCLWINQKKINLRLTGEIKATRWNLK